MSPNAAVLSAPSASVPPPIKTKVLPGVALDSYTGDPNFMASLARGLVVIEAFTPQTPQMTISQLSLRTGLSRAAVRRCLYTLVKLGFAGADESQRYSLRPKMLTLANTYTASSTLANAAQPILERMSATYGDVYKRQRWASGGGMGTLGVLIDGAPVRVGKFQLKH